MMKQMIANVSNLEKLSIIVYIINQNYFLRIVYYGTERKMKTILIVPLLTWQEILFRKIQKIWCPRLGSIGGC